MTAAMPSHATEPIEALAALLEQHTPSLAKGARADGAAKLPPDFVAPSLSVASTADGFELALGGGA